MISLFVSSRDKGWEPPSPVRASRFFENAILECRANLSLALSFDPSEAEKARNIDLSFRFLRFCSFCREGTMRFPAERISTFQFQSRLSLVSDLSRIINFCRNINLFLFLFVSKKRFSGQANFSLDLNKLDKSKKHQPVCRARITRLRECDFYSERIFTFQFIFFSPLGSWINFYRKSSIETSIYLS